MTLGGRPSWRLTFGWWMLVASVSLGSLTSALSAMADEPLRAASSPEAGTITAAADASSAEGTVADAAEENATLAARVEVASLLALRDGRLGATRSAELFRVDLRSDDAVRKRLRELDRELAAVRRSTRIPSVIATFRAAAEEAGSSDRRSQEAGDSGETADAGDEAKRFDDWLLTEQALDGKLRLEALRVRALELRKQILESPQARREELLAAEAVAVQADVARREREEAERAAEQAEEERLRALAAAQEARTGVARRLAEIRAGLEATRVDQLRARGRLAERKASLEVAEKRREETIQDLVQKVGVATPASTEADALYDEIVALLVDLRGRATALLGDIDRSRDSPRPDPATTSPLPDVTGTDLGPERERVRELAERLATEADRLDGEDVDASWSAVRSVMAAEPRVNDLRIKLLGAVSAAKRDRVLGFGEEGLAQGRREIARFRLELAWLRVTSTEILRSAYANLRRPAAIARMSFELLAVIVVVWITVVVRRRHPIWLRWLRGASARSMRSRSLVRLVRYTTLAVDAVGAELVTLAAVVLVGSLPWIDRRTGPLSVVYALFLWYWLYRLGLATTHRALAWGAAREEGIAADVIGPRILRSVRLVGRATFAIAIFLTSSAAVVGRGYLHALVVRAAWLVGFLIAIVLVRRWRDDIASAYLRVRPSGALSGLVARTRERWIGFFVVIAAFGFLLAAWVARTLRGFVLGFEHSRKALAYLFRRRLEKQVEHAPSIEPLLAADALSFFNEGPVTEQALSIDRYPGLDAFMDRVAAFRSGGARVGATLIVGRTGYGKSSWLSAARARCGEGPVVAIALRERLTTADGVVRTLASALDAPDSVSTVDALARFLCSEGQPTRRVVTVDDGQLLFLRGVQRLDGWRAFTTVLERTSDRVCWIVAFAHYPWEFLAWILQGNHVFRSIVHINPWSEAEIGELLERRTQASALVVAYDDLLVENLGSDASAELLTTARDYNRLIWDYAEGSPRVALHVWARSLAPDGPGRARVRLFANPEASVLESLSEASRFVLAAIVWHERLSLEEAAKVSLVRPSVCEDAFERLLENGVAEVHEGRLRVTARWWPLVVRYLRRKHLIET